MPYAIALQDNQGYWNRPNLSQFIEDPGYFAPVTSMMLAKNIPELKLPKLMIEVIENLSSQEQAPRQEIN